MSATANNDDRMILVGTDDGLFKATPDGEGLRTEATGLQGKGMVGHPTIIDKDDERVVYAATYSGGVCRSEDGGDTWREMNDGILYKEVWSLAQQPVTGELFAGTGPSSVFKSGDRGDTWTDCAELRRLPETREWDFPAPPHVSHVRGIAVSPHDPGLVMGAVEVGWLIRSDDGGGSWQNVQDSVWKDSHSVAFMPDDADVVLATTGNGVFRSTDAGRTFVETKGIDRTYMAQIGVHPSRPGVLLTAGAEGPPFTLRRPQGADAGLFRSEDQGATWERLTGGGLPENMKGAPRAVASDPADADAFYFGFTDGSVWMTGDGGDSFAEVLRMPSWVRSLRVTHR